MTMPIIIVMALIIPKIIIMIITVIKYNFQTLFVLKLYTYKHVMHDELYICGKRKKKKLNNS